MRVTIITATYNSAATLTECLRSVAAQDYPHIEHIIIDGASKDETLAVVAQFPHVAKVVSERDKGIYDALNKGLQAATGDIVGLLNSDDFFADTTIISKVVAALQSREVEAVFGDIVFVDRFDLDKRTRYYSSAKFHPGRFAYGYMPAHPTFYTFRSNYEKYGGFKMGYHISADYELLTRLLYVHKLSYRYLPMEMVVMREGGKSNENLWSRIVLNKEIVRACRENGIKTNLFKVSLKIFSKLLEYLFVPEKK